MAEEEDEMAKGQRYERGVRRHSYKALPLPFRIRGFLGNRSRDLRFSEFSATEGGPLPGLSRKARPAPLIDHRNRLLLAEYSPTSPPTVMA